VNNMGDSKAVRPNKKEIILPVLEKSLMFTPDELNKIKMVYNIYLERQKTTNNKEVVDKTPNVEDLLGRLNMGAPPELPPAPVGIYLDSILFRAPGNASAWINGKKYEIGISQNNIQLIKVASNYAEIEWRISGYNNATIGDWSDIFPEIDDDDAEKRSNSMPPSRQAIKVNAETKAVQVILKPNQYLDTKAKAVKEGRPVMPKDVAGVNSKNGLPNNNSPLGKLSMPEKSEEKTPESEVKKVDTTVAPQKEVKIKASENGHYDISATINGQVVTFRVDTGATYPVISKDDAKRLGIDVDKLQYSFEAKIADGTIIKSAEATVDVMTIEGLTFEKVLIMVANGNFPQPLLGSSFLNTINYNMSGGVMTITK